MYGQPGMGGMRPVPPSAGTAKTLILVALILQVIFVFVFLVLGIIAVAVASQVGLGGVFGVFFLIGGIIGLLFLWVAYEFSYKRTREGNYEGARTPTLILGILGLLGSIIVGILYIIAYVKLGDAMREQTQSSMPMQTYVPVAVPMAPSPAAAPAPGGPAAAPAAAPMAPAAPNCPRCGRPATFIAQYNRFYCYTDQQYI